MSGPAEPLEVRASEVVVDARKQELELRGDTRIDAPPFYIRSDALQVRRTPEGLRVTGEGTLGFCPCLSTPLAVRFRDATVAPSTDVIVHSPRLLVFGLPVAAAPVFWLRSPARWGLLPPEFAVRAEDGPYFSLGGHAPLDASGDRALDLRLGAYTAGGVRTDALLATASTSTRVTWDYLNVDGVAVDARGHAGGADRDGVLEAAWDVDALRGRRSVVSTTALRDVARPMDRATVELTVSDSQHLGATFAMRAIGPRGADDLRHATVGPSLRLRLAQRSEHVAMRAEAEEQLYASEGGLPAAWTRGYVDGRYGSHAGPVALGVHGRATGVLTTEGSATEPFGLGFARAEAALPLERRFLSEPRATHGARGGEWTHRVEPRVSARGLVSAGRMLWAVPVVAGADGRVSPATGSALVVDGSIGSLLGKRAARTGLEADVGAGAVVGQGGTAGATHGRIAGNFRGSVLGAEHAWVGATEATGGGHALLARALVAGPRGWTVGAMVGGRVGDADPVAARALLDPLGETSAPFFSRQGWSAAAVTAVPLGPGVVGRGGADVDLTAAALLGVRAGVEYRDPCNCFVLRADLSERIGRPGMDFWLTVQIRPEALSKGSSEALATGAAKWSSLSP